MSSSLSLSGYTLVIPSLGLGNVCQMSIDIICNTLSLSSAVRYHGAIPSSHVVPVVGANPFEASSTTAVGDEPLPSVVSALEVYAVSSHRVAFLQQRSPAKSGQHELCIADIFAYAISAGVSKLLLISAIDSSLRPESLREVRLLQIPAPERVGVPIESDSLAEPLGALLYAPTIPFESVSANNSSSSSSSAASSLSAVAAPTVAATASSSSASTPFASIYSGGGFDDGIRRAEGPDDAAEPSHAAEWGALKGGVPWVPIPSAATAFTRRVWGTLECAGYAPVYYRRHLASLLQSADYSVGLSSLLLYAREGDNLLEAVSLAKAVLIYCRIEEAPSSSASSSSLNSGSNSAAASAAADATTVAASAGGGGVISKKVKKDRAARTIGGLLLPASFVSLYGPPPDLASGLYGL